MPGSAGVGQPLGDRDRRIRAAMAAIAEVLKGSVRIGGHWSSYKPLWSLEEAVAVFSTPMPSPVYPPVYEDFVEQTVRLLAANKEIYARAGIELRYSVLVLSDRCGDVRKLDEGVECAPDAARFLARLVELGAEYGAGPAQG